MPPAGHIYKPNSCERRPATVAKQMRFLRFFARGGETADHPPGHITKSARAAHVSVSAHVSWRKTDPVYEELFQKAKRISVVALEDAVIDRGVTGILRPVGFYKGEPSAWIREYSDTLLLSALGARAPELGYNYRYQRTEITGANGGPIELNVTAQPIPLHKLSVQAQEEILAILERELGSEEVKALNTAPDETDAGANVIDLTSEIEAIFGGDLEDDGTNRVSRDIWDIMDMALLA